MQCAEAASSRVARHSCKGRNQATTWIKTHSCGCVSAMQCAEAASSRVARHLCKDRKNRVVTIGVDLPLEVFKTANGRGWGVRCSSHIPIGGFVCDYVGKLMTDTEAVNLAHYAMPLLMMPCLCDLQKGSDRQ